MSQQTPPPNELLDKLKALSLNDFAAVIHRLLERKGFDEIKLIRSSEFARTADLQASYDLTRKTYIIRAKQWSEIVRSKSVRTLLSLIKDGERGFLITTSSFSPTALAEAYECAKDSLMLIDGAELAALLHKHEIHIDEAK